MTQLTERMTNGAYWQKTYSGPDVVIYPNGYTPPTPRAVQAAGAAVLDQPVFSHYDETATGNNQVAHTD